jgi:hypothetical protein
MERLRILDESRQLHQLAVGYLHPEGPVEITDQFATGRNYFTRPSAPAYEDEEETAERSLILEDLKELKKLAVDYLHPERPVVTTDPCVTGRNYFTRPSAEPYEDDSNDRDKILEDMKELKRFAHHYHQPERQVKVDPLASCRNYFDRPSAPVQESLEEAAESDQTLADADQLKKLAVDYLHPERPVVTTDPFATGRNYFTRSSAESYEEDPEERNRVLGESSQLKKLAADHLHPEKPVVTSDPFVTGRNYFTRFSADLYEEDPEEKRGYPMRFASSRSSLSTTCIQKSQLSPVTHLLLGVTTSHALLPSHMRRTAKKKT